MARLSPCERAGGQWTATSVIVLALAVADASASASNTVSPTLRIQIVKAIAHDNSCFTEGLFIEDGVFYESAALPTRVLSYDTNGRRVHTVANREKFFAEGLSRAGNDLVQLSWKQGVARRFDFAAFRDHGELQPVGTSNFWGQGWGMCNNGQHLVISNGTEWLQYRDPVTFELRRELQVKYHGQPVRNLNVHADSRNSWNRASQPLQRINELECVDRDGPILANVWYSDWIISIRPSDGEIIDVIDAEPMYTYTPTGSEPDDCTQGHEVINGIARDPANGDLWITGKQWGCVFNVDLFDISTNELRDAWGSSEVTDITTTSTSKLPSTTETSVEMTTVRHSENAVSVRPTTVEYASPTNIEETTTTKTSFNQMSTSTSISENFDLTDDDDDTDTNPFSGTTVRTDFASASNDDPSELRDSHEVVVIGLTFGMIILALALFVIVQRRRKYTLVNGVVDAGGLAVCNDEQEEFLSKPSQLDTTQIQMESEDEAEDLVFRTPQRKPRRFGR